MFHGKSISFYVLMIFLLVLVFGMSGFSAKISLAGVDVDLSGDVHLPEASGLLSTPHPSCDSIPEIVENGYQRVYSTNSLPVTVKQLEAIRQSGKMPDIDPETGAMIIESFRDYLPESWVVDGSGTDKIKIPTVTRFSIRHRGCRIGLREMFMLYAQRLKNILKNIGMPQLLN